MIVTFLGTGTSQGVPVIACDCEVCKSVDFRDKRLRTSIHIQEGEKSIIIDTGPDFRQQVLRENIRSLDALLFTHEHKDHTAGLDDIRAFNYVQQTEMPVYARKQVVEHLHTEFAYAFAEFKYPGVPDLKIHVIDNAKFHVGDVEVTPIEVKHYKMSVLGFRINDFSYITDANSIADIELDKIKGSKVMVLNALQRGPHISHYNLEEALKVIEIINPEKAYLTHISHKLGLHRDVIKELPENVELAYDGLKLNL